MNYQTLKFISVCLETMLEDFKNSDDRSLEFLAAIREMLDATKKLMRFF